VSLHNFNLQAFGLDLSDLSFKLAAIREQSYGKHELTAWNKLAVPEGVIDQGIIKIPEKAIEILIRLRQEAKGQVPSDFAIISLPESQTFLKVLHLEKQSGDNDDFLDKMIREELPKEIPLPLGNLHYDYIILNNNSTFWEVLLGAARRDVILEYTEILKEAGIKPLAIEIEAQSIVRSLIKEVSLQPKLGFNLNSLLTKFKVNFKKNKENQVKSSILNPFFIGKNKDSVSTNKSKLPKEVSESLSFESSKKPVLLVDLGETRTGLVIYHQGVVQFTRSLELSGREITLAIAEKLKLSSDKAEQAKIICGLDPKKCKGQMLPLMRGWVERLGNELQETVSYYMSERVESPDFEKVILCGGGAALAGLAEKLQKKLSISVEVGNPLINFNKPRDEDLIIPVKSLSSLATALGLALHVE